MELRRILMGLYLLAFPAMMWGQTPVVPGTADEEHSGHRKETPVNFGFKGGFTSSLFLVSQFSVNGVPIDEVQNNYKIGYFGSLFMRINFDRHFLQPEISYNINRCNITFEKPLPEDAASGARLEEASMTSSIHSIDIPVIYGYNFIKEGPYSLAVFGGPKVRYIWDRKSDIDFENFDQVNIRERLRPLNLSFTVGVSVTISRAHGNQNELIDGPTDGGGQAHDEDNRQPHAGGSLDLFGNTHEGADAQELGHNKVIDQDGAQGDGKELSPLHYLATSSVFLYESINVWMGISSQNIWWSCCSILRYNKRSESAR